MIYSIYLRTKVMTCTHIYIHATLINKISTSRLRFIHTYIMTVFGVTKSAPQLVRPSERTPGGNLPLSFLDRVPGLRVLIASVFVYTHGGGGDDPAEVIREALSKALVHYYPVAGRIVDSGEGGDPEIACTGEGMWFVEASANCSLEDVNFLQLPLMIPKEELLAFPPPKVGENDLIFMMQVTKFTCGGFAVGLRSSHMLFDGVGQAQFLKAVGEMARGIDKPLVQPIWCREAIPSPPPKPTAPLVEPPPPPALLSYKFESIILDVSLECINRIKNRFMEETGQRCSTFDIMAAKTWQSRTRAMALDLQEEEHVHLGFPVNMRHLMDRYLSGGEGGYYGNCIYNMSLSAASKRVARAPLAEVIGLVRDAKRRAAGEFVQMVEGGETRGLVPLGRGTMCVLDWSRVGLLEVDYGWGEPMHGAPLNDHHFVAWCIFLKPLPPKQGGARVVANCVEQEHAAAFRDEMMSSDY